MKTSSLGWGFEASCWGHSEQLHSLKLPGTHSPVKNVVNNMAARQSALKKRKISSMMSAEGSDVKEKLQTCARWFVRKKDSVRRLYFDVES
mmetsp:Transcript_32567/g.79238  ORF Transcript_32567/g.79238 Transcript_32567/m.79238 type:complete len:91 (+) Transcript_32567:82-354(+)